MTALLEDKLKINQVVMAIEAIAEHLRAGNTAGALCVCSALLDCCAPPVAVYLLTEHEVELIEATRRIAKIASRHANTERMK